MAEHVGYWAYDRDAPLACGCGWSGAGADNEEHSRELLDVRCPACGTILLIVPYPTIEETRAAAAAGNARAQADLPTVAAREARLARAERLALADPSQLPDLPGESIRIAWDFEAGDGEHWTVLRHDGREIWRELAYYEGYKRFEAVLVILRERYGSRLVELSPTDASSLYLYGDSISASETVRRLNQDLGR